MKTRVIIAVAVLLAVAAALLTWLAKPTPATMQDVLREHPRQAR